ncbi:hypothetical protein BAUCODRAFT_103080 [Baudoinia panamericana UAMH 10762]|uniref:GID complex catalytic subunit 2 n=1 Tax=Baudoinia panamericana (strain UAMH 10762) TaxID=717646 RepID=M2NHY4_BAUPA|nr:uncharacterized protein BAUCODRAFT_103080 [Baudoinia panamericana UAMH 10762]EMC98685.1 hypothetical protein BAUCODRAFT_103080 [Baudoinia panamericana UAMH 10762]
MEAILAAHEALESKSNLSKALSDVDALISMLQTARDDVSNGSDKPVLHIAKLKNPLKQSFDRIEDDLKEVNKGLNQYQKALKDKFKSSTLPTAGVGGESGLGSAEQKGLVERAIAMHLLREGKFDVASTFVKEINAASANETYREEDDMQDLAKGHLQKKFADMYHILDALRNQHNLTPAIEWARNHSAELENRGSNLEFELSRLRFVELYTSATSQGSFSGPLQALDYARTTFPSFSNRYMRETSALLGSLAFSPDLGSSPYKTLFLNSTAWEDVSASFSSTYLTTLSLPSRSPLHTACTAGTIALPTLLKVERIIAERHGQWTSVNELPVETPLPSGYLFHSIFVCPVSKEQTTDVNPPMMLPCGHVIAKESLEGHARGKHRVKCPYCPLEARTTEAKRVFI